MSYSTSSSTCHDSEQKHQIAMDDDENHDSDNVSYISLSSDEHEHSHDDCQSTKPIASEVTSESNYNNDSLTSKISDCYSNGLYRKPDTLQLRCNYNRPVMNLQIPSSSHRSMIPSPTLYRYCMDDSYHATIPQYCMLHPIDTQWFDRYGNCPLHILCQKKPKNAARSSHIMTANTNILFEAINAIIKVCPECIAWPNSLTWTPYHYVINEFISACQHFAVNRDMTTKNRKDHDDDDSKYIITDVEVIGIDFISYHHTLLIKLLRACPHAVFQTIRSGYQQTNYLKTILHYACYANVPYDVLYEMLSIHPNLVTGNASNCSKNSRQSHAATTTITSREMNNPLFLLWDSYTKNRTLYSIEQMDHKMQLLLYTIYYGNVDTLSSTKHSIRMNHANIVHIVCSVLCPKEYIYFAIRKYKHLIKQQDEYGEYPIHYAVGKRSSPYYTTDRDVIIDASYQQFVIEAILSACPESASFTNNVGQLPLHLALSSSSLLSSLSIHNNNNENDDDIEQRPSSYKNKTNVLMKHRTNATYFWNHGGIRELTFANTDALQQPDPITKLVPFLLATATFTDNMEHTMNSRYQQRDQIDILSTIYELLLAAPEMLQQQVKTTTSVITIR